MVGRRKSRSTFKGRTYKRVGKYIASFWGTLELRSLGIGGVADPNIHGPSRATTSSLVVLRQRNILLPGYPLSKLVKSVSQSQKLLRTPSEKSYRGGDKVTKQHDAEHRSGVLQPTSNWPDFRPHCVVRIPDATYAVVTTTIRLRLDCDSTALSDRSTTTSLHFISLGCASGCVVECRICNREVAGSNLSLGYFAPRSTQPSIPPGSVNEYQLRLGRQWQVWLIPIADERVGVQVKLCDPLRTNAIPERFCGGDSLRRGAISSVCTFTFTFTFWQLHCGLDR